MISADNAFGAFQATLLATGWGDLDSAGVPTYAWGIHATEAANRAHIFPSAIIRCADCTGRGALGRPGGGGHPRASLGYGATENSKVCARTVAASFELYEDDTGVDVAYVNDDLAFGLASGIGPEVSAMKDAGVDFISTCMDLNGMKTLAQELDRQGMGDVTPVHPNTYNQQFVADAGELFEGDFVSVQFRPFEAETEGTALEDFLEWMDGQGDEPSELAMVGWINATLAFEGLLAAGPEFDRDKVTAATNAMTDFDAGGLIEPVDWAEAHTPYTQDTAGRRQQRRVRGAVRVGGRRLRDRGTRPTSRGCAGARNDLAWSEPEPTTFG